MAEPEAPTVARSERHPADPPAPAPRRILPSLIPPPEPEIEAPEPLRRQGRPRKAPTVAVEPRVEPIAPPRS